MDKMRERYVEEINRIKKAIEKTNSNFLKRDYEKSVMRMEKELQEYDCFKAGG